MKPDFYITTTLPYVNDKPHVGFALEIVQADTLARFHEILGENVIFNTGTDEHGVKIYRKALEAGIDAQQYVDEYAAKFEDLKAALNLSYTNFIRTTSPAHKKAAQSFWERCLSSGDIYKKNYKIKYCTGCELEKTDSELVEGKCPLHPKLEVEIIEEENYFFRLSKYQNDILEYIKKPSSIVPDIRRREAIEFVEKGLTDFSISRLKEKMPWGIEVPGDKDQVMYVWFDALVNYISTLGWPDKDSNFERYWVEGQTIQCAGKDQVRMQSIMWQGMLMSAGVPNTKSIFYHGFITSGGIKMSKSTGNVIDPFEIVNEFGTDALRYFLLAKLHSWQDSDFTREKITESYTSDLANGLGNLVSRVSKMASEFEFSKAEDLSFSPEIITGLKNFEFDNAISIIWSMIRECDELINKEEVWAIKDKEKKQAILEQLVTKLRQIAFDLAPFLPETSSLVSTVFSNEKISPSSPLFPRLNK